MGKKILGPEFLAGIDKNPDYTRAGVDRLYCSREKQNLIFSDICLPFIHKYPHRKLPYKSSITKINLNK